MAYKSMCFPSNMASLIIGEECEDLDHEARLAGRGTMQGLEDKQRDTEFKIEGTKHYNKTLGQGETNQRGVDKNKKPGICGNSQGEQ